MPEGPYPLPLVQLEISCSTSLSNRNFTSTCSVVGPRQFKRPFTDQVTGPHSIISFVQQQTRPAGGGTRLTSKSLIPHLRKHTRTVQIRSLIDRFLTGRGLSVFPRGRFDSALHVTIRGSSQSTLRLFMGATVSQALTAIHGRTIVRGRALENRFRHDGQLHRSR